MSLSDEDSKQLAMYRTLKSLIESGRVTLLQSASDTNAIEIKVELTKTGKSIAKIMAENSNGYR